MLANNAELVYGDELPFELPISSLEGYLFPDTYYFAKEQTEEGIIRQMVKRFVDHVIPKVDLSLLDHKYTLHEVITLASIVEKEVIYDFERPLVAAVYHNRLNISMRLQADPTVRYVMTETAAGCCTAIWQSIRRTIPTAMTAYPRGLLPVRACSRSWRFWNQPMWITSILSPKTTAPINSAGHSRNMLAQEDHWDIRIGVFEVNL